MMRAREGLYISQLCWVPCYRCENEHGDWSLSAVPFFCFKM